MNQNVKKERAEKITVIIILLATIACAYQYVLRWIHPCLFLRIQPLRNSS